LLCVQSVSKAFFPFFARRFSGGFFLEIAMLSIWPEPVAFGKLSDVNRLLQHVRFARASDWPELGRYAVEQLANLLTREQYAHALAVIDHSRNVRLRFRAPLAISRSLISDLDPMKDCRTLVRRWKLKGVCEADAFFPRPGGKEIIPDQELLSRALRFPQRIRR
jgi:hypothetical protein